MLCSQVPLYNDSQLAVVVRDGSPEVWTLLDFDKGDLVFAPETCEIKDTCSGNGSNVDGGDGDDGGDNLDW